MFVDTYGKKNGGIETAIRYTKTLVQKATKLDLGAQFFSPLTHQLYTRKSSRLRNRNLLKSKSSQISEDRFTFRLEGFNKADMKQW